MLPDLAKDRCVHFVVHGHITEGLKTSLVKQLVGRPPRQDQPAIARETYNVGGTSHDAEVRFIRGPQKGIHLAVYIDCKPGAEQSASADPLVGRVLDELNDQRFQATFQYDLLFELGRRASKKIFPIKFPVLGPSVIDEIRGLRGVKLESPNNIRYVFAIDSPELKELYINVEFIRQQVFHSDAIHQALREASGIVRDLIPVTEWGD